MYSKWAESWLSHWVEVMYSMKLKLQVFFAQTMVKRFRENVLHVQSIGRFPATTAKKSNLVIQKFQVVNRTFFKIAFFKLFRKIKKRRNSLSTHHDVSNAISGNFSFFVFDFLSRMISTFFKKVVSLWNFFLEISFSVFFFLPKWRVLVILLTDQEFNAFCFFFKSLKEINPGLRLCLFGFSLRSHKKEASSNHLQMVMGFSIDERCCLMNTEMHMSTYGSSPDVNIHSKQRHPSPDNFGIISTPYLNWS